MKMLDKFSGAKAIEDYDKLTFTEQEQLDRYNFERRLSLVHKLSPLVLVIASITPLFFNEFAEHKLYMDENASNTLHAPPLILRQQTRKYEAWERELPRIKPKKLMTWLKQKFTDLSLETYEFRLNPKGSTILTAIHRSYMGGDFAVGIIIPFESKGLKGMQTVRRFASAPVLALALSHYLREIKWLSRDVVFILVDRKDDHVEAMEKWIDLYHSDEPQFSRVGQFISTLVLDIPLGKFSRELTLIPVGFEATNPNMDLISTLTTCFTSFGIPLTILNTFKSDLLRIRPNEEAKIAKRRTIGRYFATQAIGNFTGYHAFFLQRNIDSATLKGIPSDKPGFYSEDVLQGTECYIRTFSNLIEKLHHSTFQYILPGSKSYLKFSSYFIPGIVLIATAAIKALGYYYIGRERDMLDGVYYIFILLALITSFYLPPLLIPNWSLRQLPVSLTISSLISIGILRHAYNHTFDPMNVKMTLLLYIFLSHAWNIIGYNFAVALTSAELSVLVIYHAGSFWKYRLRSFVRIPFLLIISPIGLAYALAYIYEVPVQYLLEVFVQHLGAFDCRIWTLFYCYLPSYITSWWLGFHEFEEEVAEPLEDNDGIGDVSDPDESQATENDYDNDVPLLDAKVSSESKKTQ